MRKYNIKVTLSDGNEINSNVDADDEFDALSILRRNDVYVDFVGSRLVKEIVIKSSSETRHNDESRFYFRESSEDGWYVVSDIDTGISVKFKRGDFNSSQYTSSQGSCVDALQIASSLREIADYVRRNHGDLL